MPTLVNCQKCGKPFYVKHYKLKKLFQGQHSLCCSRECAYQLRRGRSVPARQRRVKLNCEMCGQSFVETAIHAETRRFCSIACKAKHQQTALKGDGNPYYGHKHSEESRAKISANHFRWYGEENPNWRGGITELKILIRKSKHYKLWRNAVYRRDGYRSVLSEKRGQAWGLVAHHKKPFIEILNEMLSLHPNLSPDKDAAKLCKIAMNYVPLWDVSNGVTLLRQEHIELHRAEGSQDDE